MSRGPEIAFACSGCKVEVVAAPGAPAKCAACGSMTTLAVPEGLRGGAIKATREGEYLIVRKRL